MSLQERWQDEIPAATAHLGEILLDEDNPYRLVGEEASDFFQYADYETMYAPDGRGAVCPIVLSMVTIFQFLENLPDRAAADMAVLRIDWKYALHQELDWMGFHHTDLCYFRKRLIEHQEEQMVFGKVLDWVKSHGMLRKHGKQRTDSTHVLGAVERMSRLELVWETLRLALREAQREARGWYHETIPGAFHEAYHERQSDWRLTKDEVRAAMQTAGEDGYWLLDRMDTTAPAVVCELAEVETLRTVLEQQFKRTEGQVHTKPVPIKGKDIISTPHDVDARWAEKRGKDWVGYRLQVTETADEENAVQFITDVDTVPANDDDSEHVEPIQARLEEQELLPDEQYVDQGYTSGANLARSNKRGIELVGPVADDQSKKPDGYRQADFDLDFDAQEATCPGGRTSVSWREYHVPEAPDDPQHKEIKIRFDCDSCPVFSKCAGGKSGRSLTISAFYQELSSRRTEQQTDEFKERLKTRSAVDRGKAKVRLQHLFTGAAINIKRLARALAKRKADHVAGAAALT